MKSYRTLIATAEAGLGWIILNRPDKYNCFNEELMAEVKEALAEYAADHSIRVVAFRGEGKTFASGADIADLQRMTALDALFPTMQSLYSEIYHYPKPTIAAVHGYSLGGGMELAAACDLRIAADNVKFGLPECKLGVIPGAGGTQRLVRMLGEALVKELVFTGRMLSATEALNIGFVSRVVLKDELVQTAAELAASIAERSPLALRMAKMAINRSLDVSLDTGMMLENALQSVMFASEDKVEGVSAFLEKRKPQFPGK